MNPNSKDDIANRIRLFDPHHTDWNDLDLLINELSKHENLEGACAVESLLEIFERFPGITGAGGMFYSIIHFIEAQNNFEKYLIKSILRQPSVLSIILVGRLINGAVSQIGKISLKKLIIDIAGNSDFPKTIHEEAKNVTSNW